MANNRTEAKAAVTAAIVPAVSNAKHIALLNDEINESTVFRKDVIASETEAGGNVTIDYSNKDTATVTTAVNLTVSFTNIENGDVKYLVITKNATNTLSFAASTNVTLYQDFIDNQSTLVPYEVFNKNGVIYVRALLETIIKGDLADIQSSEVYKFTNCKAVNDYVADVNNNILTKKIDIGDWNMDSAPTKSIAHGVGDWTKILNVKVLIIIDDDSAGYPLSQNLEVVDDPIGFGTPIIAGAYSIISANIILSRLTSGWYDNVSWDKTSYNRGYVVIEYLP